MPSIPFKSSDSCARVRIEGRYCVYCGELAGTKDHFPPRSYSSFGFLLPACQECNNLAHTDFPTDFFKRAEHVKLKIRFKYRKNLKSPEWTDDEISDLGPGLREGMKVWETQKLIAQKRVAWNVENYLCLIDTGNVFVPIFVEGKTSETNKNK